MFTPVAASPFCSGIVAMLPTVTLCAGHAKYSCTRTLARAAKPAQTEFTPVAESPFCNGIVATLPAVTLCAGHAKYGWTRTLTRAVKPAQAMFTPVAVSPFCTILSQRCQPLHSIPFVKNNRRRKFILPQPSKTEFSCYNTAARNS